MDLQRAYPVHELGPLLCLTIMSFISFRTRWAWVKETGWLKVLYNLIFASPSFPLCFDYVKTEKEKKKERKKTHTYSHAEKAERKREEKEEKKKPNTLEFLNQQASAITSHLKWRQTTPNRTPGHSPH
jgi:hypothetical protein